MSSKDKGVRRERTTIHASLLKARTLNFRDGLLRTRSHTQSEKRREQGPRPAVTRPAAMSTLLLWRDLCLSKTLVFLKRARPCLATRHLTMTRCDSVRVLRRAFSLSEWTLGARNAIISGIRRAPLKSRRQTSTWPPRLICPISLAIKIACFRTKSSLKVKTISCIEKQLWTAPSGLSI